MHRLSPSKNLVKSQITRKIIFYVLSLAPSYKVPRQKMQRGYLLALNPPGSNLLHPHLSHISLARSPFHYFSLKEAEDRRRQLAVQ